MGGEVGRIDAYGDGQLGAVSPDTRSMASLVRLKAAVNARLNGNLYLQTPYSFASLVKPLA